MASDPNASRLTATLKTVADSLTSQASQVVSNFDYGSNTPDVSNLVAGYVKQTETGGRTITASTVDAIQSGTMSIDDAVTNTGDVSTVQKNILTYATDNPDLVTGDVGAAIAQLPAGI